MGWYKDWFGTPYYALLYGHRDEHEAGAWADAILQRWGLKEGASLLDMACGRGRHAGAFHQRGMQVSGIDLSAESIAEARERFPGVHFDVHDMRKPYADDTFDAAVCLFTSLGYFEGPAEDRAVLRTAFRALKPGGRFVLDLMNAPRVIASLVPEETVVRHGVAFHIRRSVEQGVIVKRIRVEDGGRTAHFEERVQALYPDAVDGMAREVGFTVEGHTGGPPWMPFDSLRSDRFVIWLRRPVA